MPTILKTKRRPWQQERVTQARRIHNNGAFYRAAPWRKLRATKMQYNPLCEECTRNGRVVSATMVDHIKPISEGGAMLDMENLQSLCNRCHNIKSGREAHKR